MATEGWNPKAPKTMPTDQSIKGRVKIDPVKFDDLIKAQGVRVKVFRSVQCPRVNSIDGSEHDIACPLCRGNQFVDYKPIETWAFVQSQTLDVNPASEGLIDDSTAAASFLSGISLQYFTLVEFMDYQDIFIERIKRQEGNIDILKYRARMVNLLVDYDGKEYYTGVDFNLDPAGNIQWIVGRAPCAGTIYSVHYEMALMFRAVKAMHVNRFVQSVVGPTTTFVKAPEQWLLQRVYLVQRKDVFGNPLPVNKIRDSDPSDQNLTND